MKTLRCLTLLINTGLAIAGRRTDLLQQHFAEVSVPNKAHDADATEIDYNGAAEFYA
jgi:hypothetical protein